METLSQTIQWSEGETRTIDETTASDHQGDFWPLVLVLVIINSELIFFNKVHVNMAGYK